MMEYCKKCFKDISEKEFNEYNGYCESCYKEKPKIEKRNKKYLYLSLILLVVFIIIFIIIDNINFKKDIFQAKIYYASQEYSKAQEILNKYPLHKSNEDYKKIEESKNFTTYYELSNSKDKELAIKYLVYGYSKCLDNIESTNDLTSQVAKEISSVYKNKLYYTYEINTTNLNELVELVGEAEKLEQKISTIVSEIEKANTCEKSNVKVISYDKSGYELDVTLRNENGCTWEIKSYSEVRVYFTDSSYEDVHLGTNINLKSNQEYTFYDCYLGSNNKYKGIRRIVFID